MTDRILVTGCSGRIGQSAVRALMDTGYHVVGFDRVPPVEHPNEFIRGEIDENDAVTRAVRGIECVVHLAAAPDDDPLPESLGSLPPDSDNFLDQLVPTNLIGPVVLLKAAVRAGVRRVVLASSGQVIDGWLPDATSRVDLDTPYAPRYLYACTKVYLEAVGRVFAKKYRIEVLAVRLGWCPRPGQEAAIRSYRLAPYVYLSGEDAGRFFVAAARSTRWPQTTDPKGGTFGYGIAYVTSSPPAGGEVYDQSAARELGYKPDPHDDWTAWLAKHAE